MVGTTTRELGMNGVRLQRWYENEKAALQESRTFYLLFNKTQRYQVQIVQDSWSIVKSPRRGVIKPLKNG
jgi:hypothetical protein